LYLEGWSPHDGAADDTVTLPSVTQDSIQLRIKRMMDVIGAVALLVLLSPVFLITAVLIRVTSPGPVFHRQKQIGWNQRPFMMWKFRTMIANAEQQEETLRQTHRSDGPFFKVKNDPRVLPIGKFLRQHSIDELPQLINVLKGEMSLVGPRPLFDFEAAEFVGWKQLQRFGMKPGLTCIWQVSGRSQTSGAARMQYDLDYVKQWSLWLDVKLLWKTIPAVLKGDGAE
jgi:lipopolysaccharide/colanic/teichoic acid biosynthesis glycosyltransferase